MWTFVWTFSYPCEWQVSYLTDARLVKILLWILPNGWIGNSSTQLRTSKAKTWFLWLILHWTSQPSGEHLADVKVFAGVTYPAVNISNICWPLSWTSQPSENLPNNVHLSKSLKTRTSWDAAGCWWQLWNHLCMPSLVMPLPLPVTECDWCHTCHIRRIQVKLLITAGCVGSTFSPFPKTKLQALEEFDGAYFIVHLIAGIWPSLPCLDVSTLLYLESRLWMVTIADICSSAFMKWRISTA